MNSDFVNGRRVMTMSEKPVSWGSARAKLGRDPERVAAARHAAESEVLAYQLVTLRKEADLTQTELSKTMGVSQRRVSAIEHGQLESFELDTIRKYVAALGGQVRVVADFGDRSVTLAS
ncbi:helix-turn-helix domain-containing protein [Plantibacter sp. CFBP 8804]|uniref:helix-turn-helix domain-containing protein n=1 Tax=Plantibacter sp. CFBP 8804 TaxID=2775270 RepID=UPI001780D5ED|nr:XRE family transcriptional regulator [Plantibacter sp. CFBP 8804]MBD8518531.1 XRE family transcriptional regulator [Plantibacter sp. CFBP 8804]